MKAIASALVKAQKEFGPALKTSSNPHFRSRYADLSACVEAVIDALNNNGIYLMQLTEEHEAGVKVSTTFIHESGEQMSGGSLFMPAIKNDPQGFGSALSYARRYSLMAACGIAPEDDDANSASKPQVAAPKPVPKPAPKPVEAPPPPPPPPPAPPKKVEGKDQEWQLKVSAQPETSYEDWLAVVVEGTVMALDMASSKNDVMNIWRTNSNIYKLIEQQDTEAYENLTSTFKTYKESFTDGE
jgi:hypothetical protein